MPDALEAARALDAEFARTGRLRGPLHGIPFAIKDQFDTFDMRTTSGAAANYANDRPPRDAEVVARLRNAGAIILAKANMGEYASGDRSTFGGTTCNPYDTSRSAGRSSGGSGAAVAANLVMCASAKRPVRRRAIPPPTTAWSVSSRPTASSAARAWCRHRLRATARASCAARSRTPRPCLGALAGYDPRDPATAASVGQIPSRPYEAFADNATLSGVRIGVVREFMQPFTKADEEVIRIANQAIDDLTKAGATIVDPGPDGALFKDAIAGIFRRSTPGNHVRLQGAVPGRDAGRRSSRRDRPMLSRMPPELSMRILAEREHQVRARCLYVLNRYLRERGDKNIKSVADLLANSTFYNHAPIDGVTVPPKTRLEGLSNRTERFTKKSDGSSVVRRVPINNLDGNGWNVSRMTLQMLVNKVMAEHKLDALVYPTKTIPAPLLAMPVEPTNIKVVKETITTVIDGEPHERTVDRVIDARAPLTWRFSPNGGFPTIVVPAGFTREVYDRAVIRGADGSRVPAIWSVRPLSSCRSRSISWAVPSASRC